MFTTHYRAQLFISPHSQPMVLVRGSLKVAPVNQASSHPVLGCLCCVFFPSLSLGGGNDIHECCQHHPRPLEAYKQPYRCLIHAVCSKLCFICGKPVCLATPALSAGLLEVCQCDGF